MPAELRGIAYQNKAVIYDLLMKASAETTLAIAGVGELGPSVDSTTQFSSYLARLRVEASRAYGPFHECPSSACLFVWLGWSIRIRLRSDTKLVPSPSLPSTSCDRCSLNSTS